jgi:pyridoxine 5-phosphate synthase
MKLAFNIDHFATLREARRGSEPEPVLAALLAEQAGAEGVVCHLRSDRRHIKERDLKLLRGAIKTRLNMEMAATDDMFKVAMDVKPDVVSLVPERHEELTTEGGLNVIDHRAHLAPFIKKLQATGISVSIFIDASVRQIKAGSELGVNLIEINTGQYAEAAPGPGRAKVLDEVRKAAEYGQGLGLEVHAGHGLDYHNVRPIAAIPQITELSIGFAIVARAAIVGVNRAVRDMVALLNKH